jgi:hypothetical protein
MIWRSLVLGMVNGAVLALLGYAKNSTSEDFDDKKALQTVIVGGVVGFFAGYYNMTYESAQEWAANSGIITIVEYVKKALWKRIREYFGF